jgi:ABC-type polysaccharide/polyol phosphate export permease
MSSQDPKAKTQAIGIWPQREIVGRYKGSMLCIFWSLATPNY